MNCSVPFRPVWKNTDRKRFQCSRSEKRIKRIQYTYNECENTNIIRCKNILKLVYFKFKTKSQREWHNTGIIIPFFSRGYAKHRNDYLLGGRLCKYVTHSDVNFWPRTWRVWVWVSCRPPNFGSCEVFKAVRAMNFVAVVMYRSQQRSQRIEVKVEKWHRLYSGLLDVARSFFFLAKEFDGFPLAFSSCRVQGKP